MCYEKPGPRCSGHTRTNFRAAKAILVTATNDLKEKTEALKGAQNAEARAELNASQQAHKKAVADLKEAEGKYQVSKENRALAMDAYRKAKSEYDATPEGIKKNRIRSANPKLSAEERKEAQQDAVEGSMRRKEQVEAWKAEQKQKEETQTIATAISNEEWNTMATSTDELVRRSVAGDPNASQEALEILAGDDSPEIGLLLATNPNTPLQSLYKVGTINDSEIRTAVIDHPTMKKHSEMLNRRRFAANPKASLDTLRELSNDPEVEVRCAVIANNRTPEELRKSMIRDPEDRVRMAVAEKTKSTNVLVEMAKDVAPTVRESVAGNRNTPERSLIGFLHDKNESLSVRKAAFFNLEPDDPEPYMEELGIRWSNR